MRICMVHNCYGTTSGEEIVVNATIALLRQKQHEVVPFIRNSEQIPDMRLGNIRAFFSGIYSFSSKKAMRRLLAEHKPDIVHVHNVFPLISPSVLGECRKAGVPVVMTVHNYRLVCPNGLHMVRGQICEKCCGGREWWCVLRNCERNLFKSLGYALRNYVARTQRLFHDNVTMYTCLTEFQKRKLIVAGLPEDRIAVIPNMCSIQTKESSSEGDYVGYVGRLSPEKGIDVLIKCAQILQSVRFRVAGEFVRGPDIGRDTPSNIEFCGFLQGDDLNMFRRQMRVAVMPSLWYETFGLILAEASLYGKPVVASRLGAMAEIVDDGKTGLLFDSGNAEDLARKIRTLWDDPELCRQMGQAGKEKALREYSPEKYYDRLMAVYAKAIKLGPQPVRRT